MNPSSFALSIGLTMSIVGTPLLANHNSEESLHHRVAAVGTLNVMTTEQAAEAATQAAAQASEVATATPADGKSVYDMACTVCHTAGIAGAPKIGDGADWGPRIDQGLDVLIEHALNGFTGSKGVMPAKGGNASLTEADVAAAVEYMVGSAQ